MIGQTVAQYKIVEKLGEGGMGTVYRAQDLKLDRTVALKFVLSSLGAGFSGQERLMREAKACASLNHPNITTVYDFGEANSHSFIVMEFVDGRTLQDALSEHTFDTAEIVSVGVQIADALEAAHAKGIIHRDLKSANVMLDAAGRVKVMDFGLAKLAESSFVTQTGTTLGTAAYMSPEQVRSEELTPKSDVYSLGVVLYELATGVTPYEHAHQLAVMYAVANEAPVPPCERNPDIPEALEAVILKAMEKDPAQRFESCGALAAALREVAPGSSVEPGYSGATPRISGATAGSPGAARSHGAATSSAVSKFRGALRPLRDKRWFRVGVPVVALAAVVSLGLLIQGPTLLGGDNDGSPQLAASAHYERGYDYWAEGRYGEAKVELERAIEMDPSSSKAWSTLAAISTQLGEYDEAIRQSEKSIELDPANTDAHYNLAFALEEKGERSRALAEYAEAVRLDSSFTEAYSALGNLLIELERPDEAVPLLLRAIEMTPDSEYLFLIRKNLGKAYLAMDRYEEAASELIQALRLNPDWPETTALLAQTYEAAGMRDEAHALWQRYVELETDPEKLSAARERMEGR